MFKLKVLSLLASVPNHMSLCPSKDNLTLSGSTSLAHFRAKFEPSIMIQAYMIDFVSFYVRMSTDQSGTG